MSTPLSASLSIANDLISALTKAFNESWNEFELAQLKREIKNKKLLPGHTEMLLGAYYAVIGDMIKMKAHHAKSKRLMPSDIHVNLNYIQSLYKCGFYEESYELAQEAVKRFPLEPTLFLMLANIDIKLGNFSEALNLALEYKKLTKQDHYLMTNIQAYHDVISEDLENDYQKLVTAFTKSIIESNIQIKHSIVVPDFSEAVQSLNYEAFANCSDEEAAKLSVSFTDNPVLFDVDRQLLSKATFQVIPFKNMPQQDEA